MEQAGTGFNNGQSDNQIFAMKKTLTALPIALLACLFTGLHGQNNQKKPQADISIHLEVYYQTAAIGDVNMQITALQYLVASDPVKYDNWQDTIALLYLRNNAFQQARVLSNTLLDKRGYSDLRMEIKAVCAKALQLPAESIDAYAILYHNTSNPAYGFE